MSRRALVNVLVQKGQISEPLYTYIQSDKDGYWSVTAKIDDFTQTATAPTKALAVEIALSKIPLPKMRAKTSKLPRGIWTIQVQEEVMDISFSSATRKFEAKRPATTNLYAEMWKLYNEHSD